MALTDLAAAGPHNLHDNKTMTDTLASENWQRYQYGIQRGHSEYCVNARICDNFYLGGGLQWSAADLAVLKGQKRPAYEFNEVMPACNAAIGYQIQNRMDIAFKPRGGNADQAKATIRSKVAMQIADRNKLHWKETQVFSDGIIQQRGYYDIRMNFDNNIRGEVDISTLDPMDVIPDPDAKDYDPSTWSDVIITRWLTIDGIGEHYGEEARKKVEATSQVDSDFGDEGDMDEPRSKFGDRLSGSFHAWYMEEGVRRVRVIERQHYRYTMTRVAISPEGDVSTINDDVTPEEILRLKAIGNIITKRMKRRVRWTASTYDTILHDDWSPYDDFTIVPYFAFFRRGRTRGIVDNAIGPQEALNKAISQEVHIVNTTANSGWTVEENTLTNMTVDELKEVGASTGLVIEHKLGTKAPSKIQPNSVPSGIDNLIQRSTMAIKDVTVPEAMRGIRGPEVSGIAIQAKQFASQQQLAVPLDNLARTRNMLAERIHKLTQLYYTDERVFRITETDPRTGRSIDGTIVINQFDANTGLILNDMTEGEYDVVVSDQPLQTTFENSQFTQAIELRKNGIAIPDQFVIRHSNLADKEEILNTMEQPQPDPEKEAKAQLLKVQAEKVDAETKNKRVEGFFSAIQAGNLVAANPAIAGVADGILGSVGVTDMNASPLIPVPPAGTPSIPVRENTSPNFPANPDVGMMSGIEGGKNQPERT